MQQLFQYAILLQEKRNKDGDVVEEGTLIKDITTLVARDQGQAQMLAAREIPEDHLDKLDRLTVVVRPF